MSIEIIPAIICDGCQTRIDGSVEHRIGYGKMCAQNLREKVIREGWMPLTRGRYHTEAHYCPACKDKPIKPIPRRVKARRDGARG